MRRLLAAAAALLPPCARAHHPAGTSPSWDGWGSEPWVVASLAAAAIFYAVGLWRLWRRAGRGRGISPAQAGRFAAGWAVLALALASPIDALGGALFSAHMAQHELLMVVAAPLLVAARPLEAWAWSLAPRWRRLAGRLFRTSPWRAGWRAATTPLGAWLIHAVVLWAWHVPALFAAALAHEGLHALQHASFLASALLFWWSVLGQPVRPAAALASAFTTMLHTGALGALLTFAPAPWYARYADTLAYGLTPLEDQQLGGLLMWVPGGAAYFAVALAIVARWVVPAAPRPPQTIPRG